MIVGMKEGFTPRRVQEIVQNQGGKIIVRGCMSAAGVGKLCRV